MDANNIWPGSNVAPIHRAGAAPFVSVITPTYNRAHVLLRAVQSVLEQDFVDFELLVIDDGSTDDTARLLADLEDPRVNYSRFEINRGIGAARYEGVARARGTLVAFLDSDDCWKPGKLTKVVAAFAQHPQVDLVFSDFEDINYISNTREKGLVNAEVALRRLHISPLAEGWWAIQAGVPEGLMRLNFVGPSSVVVMRHSVFERVGNFREDLSGPEDLEMWWRAAVLGARFAYTTDVLVERHKDRGSITAQKRVFATRRLKALDACEETARRASRLDLLTHVDSARCHTWCDLIEVSAREANRGEAWKAFRSSVPYGLSLEALRNLAIALAGPHMTAWVRRFRGA
jgi:GT2 family glycosyltransferase